MAKAAASAEPSMEEILASIRRIIADEPEGKEAAAPKPAPAKAAAPKREVETMAKPALEDEHISEEDLDKLFAQSGDDEDEPEMDVDDADDGDEPEVLDLADVATVDEAAALELVEGLKDDEAEVAFAEPDSEPLPSEPPKAAAPRARPAPEPEVEEPLVSAAASATVQSAFGQLSHTVLAANARTLDDLVKEMLRPMLRAWLDENLPVIVERLVRAEIERVSRGR
ncbi:PopZ family protein [Pleomorphomonas carboxyditropha]|uniref:Pole-organizing protein PopZ n=1 Tax=Pleomorphomonas carboxyditropha TaxID=2023338 RepID=A0A2G9WVK4_9HYPH|nr:DUF2497 domain-containing protein [Pleomorphomonas carboxyditropha]PIO98741.1 hypothetical protein CJ014_13645 [Pleomorphomonas carboxyditropha]